MFCQICGGQVPEGMVCACTVNNQQQQTVQQAAQSAPPPIQQQPMPSQQQPGQQYYAPPPQNPIAPPDPKVTCMKWSYIFVFWLLCFNKDYKDDPLVRFHAGQGIMLTIVTAALLVARDVIISSFSYMISLMLRMITFSYLSSFPRIVDNATFTIGLLINAGILTFYLIFMFTGISNASKKIMKPLPIFGKVAFYK
ncbi:MAG: hypothetical protein FWH08_03085 [Oscillospiraceae bacterium]|nr:hypothetical protein [Oscillospiraceae bacterium]